MGQTNNPHSSVLFRNTTVFSSDKQIQKQNYADSIVLWFRPQNYLIPGTLGEECAPGRALLLNGAAWTSPTWYRTKMLRVRKGEDFQKTMMPLCKGTMISLLAAVQSFMSLQTWALVVHETPWHRGSCLVT